MNIGKNITAFRKDAGMTQEELANQIGVSAQAVSKWETGVSMPDILLLPVIADVFGITVDEIYTGKKEQSELNQTKHYSFNELPEMMYQQFLETDSYAWESNTEEERKAGCVRISGLPAGTYAVKGYARNAFGMYSSPSVTVEIRRPVESV